MNRYIWGNCLWQQRVDSLEQEGHFFSGFCEIWNHVSYIFGPLFSWSNSFFRSHLVFCLFYECCLLGCEMLDFRNSITATWINWFVGELLHQKKGTKIISHLDGFFFSWNLRDWFYIMWKKCLTYIKYIRFSDVYSKGHQKFRYTKMLKER